MSEDKSISKLVKLYELAMRGEGGEADNARRFLDAALKKCSGITLADVERAARSKCDDCKELFTFHPKRWAPGLDRVVCQLVFSFGLREEGFMNLEAFPYRSSRKKYIVARLNKAEYALLMVFLDPCSEAYYKTYRNMTARHRRERKDLPDAFISYNDLYDMRPNPNPPTDEEKEAYTPPVFDWNDMEEFSHEHDRVLADSRPQIEGGNA